MDKFLRNVLFLILDFFIRNRILIYFSGTQKSFLDLFFRMHYFQFQIFIFIIKGIFGIFEIKLGVGNICLHIIYIIKVNFFFFSIDSEIVNGAMEPTHLILHYKIIVCIYL